MYIYFSSYIIVHLQKPDIWSKKNAGVLERSQRDFEAKQEEENVFEKSKSVDFM